MVHIKHVPFILLFSSLNLSALSAPSPLAASDIQPRQLGEYVPNSYIVILKRDVTNTLFRRHTSRAEKKFSIGSFQGYLTTFAEENEVAALSLSPEVDWIERNGYTHSAVMLNTSTPSWNLHRISHREPAPPPPAPYSYVYSADYLHGNCTTEAYIIDTGIYIGHSEFEGRASHGYNVAGGGNEDGTGHGTHVAGILIGKTFGVAKKGRAISVKALDSKGWGSFANIIEAISWSVNEARVRGRLGKSVVNLSLVGLYSESLNAAVEAAYAVGVPVVSAAGNYASLAVKYSPASAPNVITIGAIDITDTKPKWSNYGIVLDHFAPGVNVRSASIAGPNSTMILSGTSMAAPHVSGLINYLQCVEGLTVPRMIRERLEMLAIKKEVVNGGNTSPHRIVYNGAEL